MKFFIKKLAFFLLLPTLVLVVIIFSLGYYHNHIMSNYKLSPDIHTIFIGDSHIRMALDDELIPNSVNLSQNAESYKFSYLKLKTLFENNSQIRSIYLGYSHHNISSYYEDYIHGKSSILVIAKYFFILPFESQVQSLMANRDHLVSYVKSILINGTRDVFVGKAESYIGFYENKFSKSTAKEKSIRKRIKFLYYKNGQVRGFSPSNLYYLTKIKELCQQKNVSLTLLYTPTHSKHLDKIPSKFKTKFSSVLKETNLDLIELNDPSFSDSSFSPDGDHVSRVGAKAFSLKMNETLKSKSKIAALL